MGVILFIFATILSLKVVAGQDIANRSTIPPVVTFGSGKGICPTTEERNDALLKVKNNVIQQLFNGSLVPSCGEGIWYRVAYLNMTDPQSQRCPSVWREYNSNGFRACGRPVSTVASQPGKLYTTHRQYSKVCGRIIAIQVASPDGFHSINTGINEGYIDGVSVTYGSPRTHIWSFVGSYSEQATESNACPCDYIFGNPPQSFVGTNYYCESGNPTGNWQGQSFPNDKLWDGQQCSSEGTCCSGANTPPWFKVNLSSPTSDDIEIRIMGTESTTNEDTPIELLEIYVQ